MATEQYQVVFNPQQGRREWVEYYGRYEDAKEAGLVGLVHQNADVARINRWEEGGLHGTGWYTLEDLDDIERAIEEMGKIKASRATTGAQAAPVAPEVKLSKTAAGQLLKVALGHTELLSISSAALAELTAAGMVVQEIPKPPKEDQTLEYQIKRNKEALAKLAYWAKTACPKDPFKGGPEGRMSGYEQGTGRYYSHPAMEAWQAIKKPQEYKVCPKTVLSDKAWEWLAQQGINKPKTGSENLPCANR